MTPPSDLLHPCQVAARYGITPETLSNWRRERKGPPFVRLGQRRVMYRAHDVDEWERARLTGSQTLR